MRRIAIVLAVIALLLVVGVLLAQSTSTVPIVVETNQEPTSGDACDPTRDIGRVEGRTSGTRYYCDLTASPPEWATISAAGNPAFSDITAGTNTNALVVGSGGTLGVSGTGTIAATSLASGGETFGLSASVWTSSVPVSVDSYLRAIDPVGGSIYADFIASASGLDIYTGTSGASISFSVNAQSDVYVISSAGTHTFTGVATFNSTFNGSAGGNYSGNVGYLNDSSQSVFVVDVDGGTAADNGTLWWYNPGGTIDTNLYRESAALLATDHSLHVNTDITVDGELKGSRQSFCFVRTGTISADTRLPLQQLTLPDNGLQMWHAGSIIGLMYQVSSFDGTGGNGSVNFECNLDTGGGPVDVFSINKASIGTGIGGSFDSYSTQARGTDTFSAGDYVSAYVDFGTYNGDLTGIVMCVEVQFDD